VASPRWSPKGDQILFSRGVDPSIPMYARQSIWSVHPLGGLIRLITDDARNPAWSADGSRIVFERGSDIWICAADGGNQRRLEGVPASQNLLAYRTPSFSPDGSWIAFFHPETGPKGDFWMIPAQGENPGG
jgi:Tol biopolymer transport system component